MITYHNGDLLESGCEIIAHQVNLQGCMGGGIARQIALKYPKVEEYYKKWSNKVNGGDVIFRMEDNRTFPVIANCFSQELNFDTNYEWIKKCFNDVKEVAKNYNWKTIGVPFKYGCGIANGDWDIVLNIFKEIFENENDIDFQIWKF